jgi:organic radical activating enzyme
MGQSAYFVRFYGCPLKCKWCDSAGTWHKDWVPRHINKLDESEIYNLFVSNFSFLVLTGGEPTIFDLNPLTNYIKQRSNIPIHIETSGAFQIKGEIDWVTLSPKWDKLPLSENLERANEIKIIVENEESIDKWMNSINIKSSTPIWLHPEWSQRNNIKVLNSISNYVKRFGKNFRAGCQLHKLYNVDTLDKNTKLIVPLGGIINNGY